MGEGMAVTDKAMRAVIHHLESLIKDGLVVAVDADPQWQPRGVDLIWQVKDQPDVLVEVKGDRHYRTGNFFLETESNVEKGTPGCFVSTESEIFAYYFVDVGELHLLPTKPLQQWFAKNRHRFERKLTGTRIAGRVAYHTAGHVVPRSIVRQEFPDYPIVKL